MKTTLSMKNPETVWGIHICIDLPYLDWETVWLKFRTLFLKSISPARMRSCSLGSAERGKRYCNRLVVWSFSSLYHLLDDFRPESFFLRFKLVLLSSSEGSISKTAQSSIKSHTKTGFDMLFVNAHVPVLQPCVALWLPSLIIHCCSTLLRHLQIFFQLKCS